MEQNSPQWADLLNSALTEPGSVHAAYQRFHNYSLGNQILAGWQCAVRNIPIGPIGTFMHWKEAGRNVKKGEKAIQLCMPVGGKRTATKHNDATGQDESVEIGFTRFVYRNNWFALSQTEGAEYHAAPPPEWDEQRALDTLNIQRVEFASMQGNCQGYATGRTIAVSPVAGMPVKTLLHEIAHVVLGHTAELQMSDGDERTPKDIRELEAESVAMLVCASLGLPGVEFSRGYIQGWYSGNTVPEKSAQKIFRAADAVLKAGYRTDSQPA